MVPPEGGRSIRNIPIPESKQRREKQEERREVAREVREEFVRIREEHDVRPPRTWKWKKWYGYALGALGVVVLAVVVSSMFHSAQVSVTPRILTADMNVSLSAKKSAGAADLAFSPLSIKKIGSVTVKASGEEQVEKKASGTIVIYNNYSSASQRLIKNTRFQTPEGLIFRIDQSVTVPGKKGDIPGSVEAVVYADEAGEKYNVGLKDFTIPGFKGDPRHTAFYAKSKPSSPIAGGFSGVMKVVSDADRKAAQAEIEKNLRAELLKEAEASLSSDMILFDNAYLITFTALPQEAVGNDQVTIKEEGMISGYLLSKKALSMFAARAVVKEYENEPILIENLEDLTFTAKKEIYPATDTSVSFALSGQARFVWAYDEKALAEGLAGASRDEVPSIIRGFPTIDKMDISMSPFWRRSFPDDAARIEIIRAEP